MKIITKGCQLFLSVLVLLAVAGGTSTLRAQAVPAYREVLPFDPVPYENLINGTRKVFAHYFTPFPISIDNKYWEEDYYTRNYLNPYGENGKFLSVGGYLRNRPIPRPVNPENTWRLQDMLKEVQLAKAIGLDGFAADILSYQGTHWERILMLLEAARVDGGGFTIMLMPDMNAALRSNPDQFIPMIETLSQYPAAMRLADGRLVVAPYMAHLQTPDWWGYQLAELKRRGIDVALVPLFHSWQKYYLDYAHLSYGVSDWGSRNASSASYWSTMADTAHSAGLIWMAPVAPQDMRPKNAVYWEARNSELFRAHWEAAIQGGADWVQLITWNDYSEHTSIAPSTLTNYAFHDLTAYYVTWFKSGQRPQIKRDAIYSFQRAHSSNAYPDPELQSKLINVASSSDMPRNNVEMVAILTAPAMLEIELGGSISSKYAEAGITSFTIPLAMGTPTFRIVRDGVVVVSMIGANISDNISVQNYLYHGDSSLRANTTSTDTDTVTTDTETDSSTDSGTNTTTDSDTTGDKRLNNRGGNGKGNKW